MNTTPKFRTGDVVGFEAVVEFVSGDYGELRVRSNGQSLYEDRASLKVVRPVFEPGDRVLIDAMLATGVGRGTVVAVALPFLWIREDDGEKPITVPATWATRLLPDDDLFTPEQPPSPPPSSPEE